jgi:hypothetical protein
VNFFLYFLCLHNLVNYIFSLYFLMHVALQLTHFFYYCLLLIIKNEIWLFMRVVHCLILIAVIGEFWEDFSNIEVSSFTRTRRLRSSRSFEVSLFFQLDCTKSHVAYLAHYLHMWSIGVNYNVMKFVRYLLCMRYCKNSKNHSKQDFLAGTAILFPKPL